MAVLPAEPEAREEFVREPHARTWDAIQEDLGDLDGFSAAMARLLQ